LSSAVLDLVRTAGDGVAGSLTYTSVNGNVWTGPVSGNVSVSGVLTLNGRVTSTRTNGVVFFGDLVDWKTSLSSSLGIVGSYSEVITWVGERDQGFTALEIIRGSK
jgi:hypothetical protein